MAPDSDWFPDPGNPEGLRWWSGTDWTKHTLPAGAIAPKPEPEPELLAVVEPAASAELPPLLPDGPIRVAPAARVKQGLPKQVRRPSPEPTSPIIVPSQGKVIDPNSLTAAASSLTLLPGADDEPVEQPRRRRRRSKQG